MSLLALDRFGGEAVYSQIARLLEEEIHKFHLPGSYLPSEAELAQRFGVNRHTLRRAVDELIHAGLVERCHGKGTRVLDALVDYTVGKVTRFTEQLEAEGMTTETRILRKLVIPARGGVARRLRLAEESSVIWLETLRLVDERPYCVISHFLPLHRFPGLPDDYNGGSLHDHLLTHYGVLLRRIESLVTASLPLGDDATLLHMPQHQAVLRVKSVNVHTENDVPVEYSLTRFRADRIQLRVCP